MLSQIKLPDSLVAHCWVNERVTDVYAYMLVLTGVAISGDHDQFCFVIIQFQKVVGHPYLDILDTGFKTRYCCLFWYWYTWLEGNIQLSIRSTFSKSQSHLHHLTVMKSSTMTHILNSSHSMNICIALIESDGLTMTSLRSQWFHSLSCAE